MTIDIEYNQCPICGNFGFHNGPRGGLSRNIFCANPGCRAGFNVAFVGQTLVQCDRIEPGEDKFYPPKVHVLTRDYLPLCSFTRERVTNWPRGHGFILSNAWDVTKDITCPQCLALFSYQPLRK
jgi:hypothetical protein